MLTAELIRRNARAHLETVRNSTRRRRKVDQAEVDDFVLWAVRLHYSNGCLDRSLLDEIEADIRERTAPALRLVSAETE